MRALLSLGVKFVKISLPPVCGEKDASKLVLRLVFIGESFTSHSTFVMFPVLVGEKHLILAFPLGVKVNKFSGSRKTI